MDVSVKPKGFLGGSWFESAISTMFVKISEDIGMQLLLTNLCFWVSSKLAIVKHVGVTGVVILKHDTISQGRRNLELDDDKIDW